MATIRVTVMAVADPSMRNVFNTLDQAATKAYGKVSGGAKRSAKESAEAIKAGLKDQANAQGSAYRQSARVHNDDVNAVAKAEAAKTREVQRNEAIRMQIRNNTMRKMQSDEEQQARRSGTDAVGNRRRFTNGARDFGRDVVGTVGRGTRAVLGGAGEVARGAGIDPSLGGLTQKVIATEDAARRSTLSGFIAINAKRNAKGLPSIAATETDVASTVTAVRAAGDSSKTSYGDVSLGLESLVSSTGDLDGSKKMLHSIGEIAKATGSNFVDLAGAAGAIAIAIDDADPNKVEKIGAALRLVATQGALGTVEIKDMAVLMSKLVSPAERIGKNLQDDLGDTGAIAQMSRHAGRVTATEQASTANAFVRDLTKDANLKSYKEAGLDVFANKEGTKLRSVEDLIVESFSKTGGNIGALTKLFPNEASKAGVMGMHSVYTNAGGGKEGEAALRAEFKKFSSAMSEADVASSSALAKGSKSASAQDMQNRFETTWAAALDKIVPAMERLAPSIGKVADSFAGLVVYLAENPGKALVMAITASIAKAGIGAAAAGAIEKMIMGGGGKGGVPGAPGGGLGVAGNLLAGLTIAATAVTITGAGMVVIDKILGDKDKKDAVDRMKNLNDATFTDNIRNQVERGAISKDEAMAELQKRAAERETSIELGKAAPEGILQKHGRGASDAFNFITGGGPSFDATTAQMNAKDNFVGNVNALSQLQTAMAAVSDMPNKKLTVHVANMPLAGLGAPFSMLNPSFLADPDRT